MLVAEKEQNKRERDNALNERVPHLKLSGLSAQELQVSPKSKYMVSISCENKSILKVYIGVFFL